MMKFKRVREHFLADMDNSACTLDTALKFDTSSSDLRRLGKELQFLLSEWLTLVACTDGNLGSMDDRRFLSRGLTAVNDAMLLKPVSREHLRLAVDCMMAAAGNKFSIEAARKLIGGAW